MRILHSTRPTTHPSPFVAQITEHAPSHVEHAFSTAYEVLCGKFDVFHVHWPEHITGDRRVLTRWGKRIGFLWLMARIRLTGKPVVRTLHNATPHREIPWIQELLIGYLDRQTSFYVLMTDASVPEGRGPTAVIPHGHYVDRFVDFPRSEPVPGRLVHFGWMHPYKGTLDLLRAFTDLQSEDLTLRLAGSPSSDAFADQIRGWCERDPRIAATLQFVSDEELVREVSAAELVVLPYIRGENNSGAALAALSLNRPILMRESAISLDLAESVGPGWVYTFSNELTGDEISGGLARVRADRSGLPLPNPNLTGRDWRTIALAYADVYDRLLTGCEIRER